jgi:hypothetical protein
VCAGFSLYINRRVGLEGWDLELVLRRLARRLAPGSVLAAILLFFLALPAGQAQPAAGLAEPTPERIAREAARVLQQPEFGLWRERTVWRPAWQRKADDGRGQPGWTWNSLSGLATWLARLAPWLLGTAAVGTLAYLLLARRSSLRRRPGARALGPAVLRAGGPPPEALPADWTGAARAAWAAGRPERAFSLLYRGALALLETWQGRPLPGGATEREALARARGAASLDPVVRELLEQAAGAWQEQAYGLRAPSFERFAWVAELAGSAVKSTAGWSAAAERRAGSPAGSTDA